MRQNVGFVSTDATYIVCALTVATEPDQLVGCVFRSGRAEVVDIGLESAPLCAARIVWFIGFVGSRDQAKVVLCLHNVNGWVGADGKAAAYIVESYIGAWLFLFEETGYTAIARGHGHDGEQWLLLVSSDGSVTRWNGRGSIPYALRHWL